MARDLKDPLSMWGPLTTWNWPSPGGSPWGDPPAAGGEQSADQAFTVQADGRDVYRFLRNFENLAHFMQRIHAVGSLGMCDSRWLVHREQGEPVPWDVSVTEELPGEFLEWSAMVGDRLVASGGFHVVTARKMGFSVVSMRVDDDLDGNPTTGTLLGARPRATLKADLGRLHQRLQENTESKPLDLRSLRPHPMPAANRSWNRVAEAQPPGTWHTSTGTITRNGRYGWSRY